MHLSAGCCIDRHAGTEHCSTAEQSIPSRSVVIDRPRMYELASELMLALILTLRRPQNPGVDQSPVERLVRRPDSYSRSADASPIYISPQRREQFVERSFLWSSHVSDAIFLVLNRVDNARSATISPSRHSVLGCFSLSRFNRI